MSTPINRKVLATDVLRKAMLISEFEITEIFDRYGLDYSPSNDNTRYKMCSIIQTLENEVATVLEERDNYRVLCNTLQQELNK